MHYTRYRFLTGIGIKPIPVNAEILLKNAVDFERFIKARTEGFSKRVSLKISSSLKRSEFKMRGGQMSKKRGSRSATVTLLIIAAVYLIYSFITGGNSLGKQPASSSGITGSQSSPVSSSAGASGTLKVSFIDVGQADSILLQQGDSFMMVDAGNNDDEDTVGDYLKSQGVRNIEYFIGTHKDEDHIGSADYVIKSFNVQKVYFPKQTATTETFRSFVNAVKSKGLHLTVPKVSDQFRLGGANVTCLAPQGGSYQDSNNYSIVLKVAFGQTSFLLTGDAETSSEKEMLSSGRNLSATVLKVAHHGSGTSTSQAFLNRVKPKYAVISVGKDNKYGHPDQKTMDRLKRNGISVYRTDESGTIVATSDGRNVSFNVKPGSYKGIIH